MGYIAHIYLRFEAGACALTILAHDDRYNFNRCTLLYWFLMVVLLIFSKASIGFSLDNIRIPFSCMDHL